MALWSAAVEPQQGKLALSLHDMLSAPAAGHGEDASDHAKKNFQPYHAQSVPRPEKLEAHRNDRGAQITTVMLRNIPNKYTQNTLLQEINDSGFHGTYNFFYLPMDVHNRSNVGYAFINFEQPADAERFRRAFSDHRFQRFHSRKIGSVCVAHVQGLDENLRHFENRAVTQARNDQYRPIVLKGQRRIDFEDAVAEVKNRTVAKEVQHVAPEGGVGVAREGLEAAILEYLAGSNQSATPGSGNPMVQVPIQQTPPGLEQASSNSSNVSNVSHDADGDIAQLLSLRSFLLDRLVQKKEVCGQEAPLPFGPPPGFESKATLNMSPEREVLGQTPRTNDLILWSALNGMSQDELWHSL